MLPDPTRRAVIGAAAAGTALLLAGCRGVQVLGTPPAAPADVTALQGAIGAEQLMIDRYQAALRQAADGQAGPLLSQLLGQHRAHLAQLTARLVTPPGTRQPRDQAAPQPSGTGGSSPAGSGTGGPGTGVSGTGVPADPAQALQFLADAEGAAAARLLRELLTAPPSLAQLLASISAAEASHGPALRAAGRAG
ncbi:MAG TPA: hypothetical protein VGI64_05855 [Streptosporangiaceae bacterium]